MKEEFTWENGRAFRDWGEMEKGAKRAGLSKGIALATAFLGLGGGIWGVGGEVGLGLGVLVCVAVLWLTEALPLAATALLVPVLASLFGVLGVKESFASFSHPLIFLFFGSFAIAVALSAQGLDRWVANAVLRVAKGRFWVVVGLLFVVTAVLSMWMTNTATTAVMIPLVLGMQSRLGLEKGGKTMVFLLLGVAYSSSLGGLGTIVGTVPNGIAAEALGIGFGEWMKFGIPVVLVVLPLMLLVLFWILRPQSPGQLAFAGKFDFEFHRERMVLLVVFLLTALAWMNGKWLGSLVGIEKGFESVVAVAAVVVLLGAGVVSWKQVSEGVDWGVLLLFGGGLTLSVVMRETGASEFLARSLKEVIEGWPLVLILGAVVLFIIFLTELTSNTATTAVMVPIFAAVATEMGFAEKQLVLPLVLAASCAFMLPVATPPNAIVFGTGQINRVEMMRVGLVLNLVLAVALTLMARLVF